MSYIDSEITWFDEDIWIGRILTFQHSKWKVIQKLAEVEPGCAEDDFVEIGWTSECRSVFIVSNVQDSNQEAVVKMRMQYV